MKYSIVTQIRSEISTFADDVDDIVYENDGSITFEKLGNIFSLQLFEREGQIAIRFEGNEYSYKSFLAKELAHLDHFAKKILQNDNGYESQFYVDPDAILVKTDTQIHGKAKDVLQNECDRPAWLGARVVFVTADAGHGKSFLLRQFQREQAKKYLEGKTDYIFWHIDLHGRELVRLNEAIMYELGDLRITGLYYNSIITLIKNGLIILGIDGFDELAAEKGGDVALGSLTNLVSELSGDGILIAASRRTFFDTQDYIQRAGLMNQKISSDCEFNEIRLQNWGEKQCVDYLNRYYNDAQIEYNSLKSLFLSTSNHPLLERPFLFTKIVSFAYDDDKTPYEFVVHGGSDLDSINNIIGAFVKREVNKWSTTEKDSGKPYLVFEQHIRLLSDIAHEMWIEQKDYISIDTIAFILTILFDEWGTDISLRPRITKMAESHALLPISNVGDKYRRFDHEEFRNFFLALAFSRVIKSSINNNNFSPVYSFLKNAQLPDTVSQYLILQFNQVESMVVLDALMNICRKELKSTYAQPNVGTLVPYILDKLQPPIVLDISNRIVFSSLVFENKKIINVHFHDCNFINISLKNTIMENVQFDSCTFTDIRFNNIANNNRFNSVIIRENCTVNKITIIASEDEYYSEYSPNNINTLLSAQGILRSENISKKEEDPIVKNPDFRKAIKRFLNKYNTSTFQYEKNISDEQIYNARKRDLILYEVIPLLIKHNIIEEIVNSKTIQVNSKAWRLKHCNVPDIYKAEEDKTSPYFNFWQEVNNHE